MQLCASSDHCIPTGQNFVGSAPLSGQAGSPWACDVDASVIANKNVNLIIPSPRIV